jgi:hypothetical protein
MANLGALLVSLFAAVNNSIYELEKAEYGMPSTGVVV